MKHSKLVFLQAAEAARICQAEISQAEFVKTLKLVFCQAKPELISIAAEVATPTALQQGAWDILLTEELLISVKICAKVDVPLQGGLQTPLNQFCCNCLSVLPFTTIHPNKFSSLEPPPSSSIIKHCFQTNFLAAIANCNNDVLLYDLAYLIL